MEGKEAWKYNLSTFCSRCSAKFIAETDRITSNSLEELFWSTTKVAQNVSASGFLTEPYSQSKRESWHQCTVTWQAHIWSLLLSTSSSTSPKYRLCRHANQFSYSRKKHKNTFQPASSHAVKLLQRREKPHGYWEPHPRIHTAKCTAASVLGVAAICVWGLQDSVCWLANVNLKFGVHFGLNSSGNQFTYLTWIFVITVIVASLIYISCRRHQEC